MQKILVTGANGFIGKNLCDILEKNGYSINKVLRDTPHNSLIEMVKQSNFCFHFAGEVRSQASKHDFEASNVNFTAVLIEQLEYNPMDIVFTSSVHAETPKNPYGETKQLAETMINQYADKFDVNTHIYRLPHMFGKGCKPDYNSVITTWIVNAIKGNELVVFDDNYKMSYLYINDLISTLLRQMQCNNTICLPETSDINLGDLKNLINSILNKTDITRNDKFVSNLRDTITYYKSI